MDGRPMALRGEVEVAAVAFFRLCWLVSGVVTKVAAARLLPAPSESLLLAAVGRAALRRKMGAMSRPSRQSAPAYGSATPLRRASAIAGLATTVSGSVATGVGVEIGAEGDGDWLCRAGCPTVHVAIIRSGRRPARRNSSVESKLSGHRQFGVGLLDGFKLRPARRASGFRRLGFCDGFGELLLSPLRAERRSPRIPPSPTVRSNNPSCLAIALLALLAMVVSFVSGGFRCGFLGPNTSPRKL